MFMRHLLLATSLLAMAPALPTLAQAAPLADAATPLADAPGPVPPGKLPDAAIPTAYRLDLTVDPSQARFSGHVEIDATLKEAGRFLYISGRDLAVRKASATVAGQSVPAEWKQVDDSGVALLTFARPLPAGPVTLVFDYDAPFGDAPVGLFHVKVGDQWYGWTQFESTDARAAYPGFDQPGYKQPFTVTLRTPRGLMAVSNAPETGVTQEGDWDVHHFAPTAPLPTYLLAMMVGPFAHADGAVPPTPQRATPLPLRIITSQNNADKTAFALANAPSIVQHLEAYFGQSFPYPKLDLITAPTMPGAMENAGADLFEDSLLALGPNASTAQKREFGMVVAHELAHQWFGDLVTPAWWDDIWLNESFANWMGYRIGHEWRPDLNIAAGALAEGFSAMGTDALLAGRPIHQAITRTNQIDSAFDTITYGKGGHVVAMIAAFMGDEKFKEGVRRYMAAHRYGNATSAQFFGAMADVAGDPRLLPAMQSFTDQQGVPLITFTGADGHYTATQSRYARLGTTPPPTRWGVPMCLRRGDTRQCQLLDGASAPVSIEGNGPLMPNAGGTGYYRFELPAADWDALIAQSASLPGGEGLALADSLFASFQAGRASAAQLAELARVMATNPDSYAANAGVSRLEVLEEAGFLDAPATAAYRAFIGRLFAPHLAAAGFDPSTGAYASEDPEASQKRVQIVRQMVEVAQDKAVRAKAGAAARAWLAGNTKALDPVWYGVALGVVVDEDGLPAAKALFEKALASQEPLFRRSALGVLGDSGRADVAAWVLGDARDPRLRVNERLGLVVDVVENSKTRDIGYAWVRGHLDELTKGSAGIFEAARLPSMLGSFCSVAQADAISRDFGPRFAGQSGELELARAIERVRDCGVLKDARAASASAEIARLK